MPTDTVTSSSGTTKRQRIDARNDLAPSIVDNQFIQDDAADSGGDDDDEDDPKPKDKKAGRRKIKIEFIQDKSRRHITFSKRKAGIMKKAYELSTLTGTQVLLLVVSETGLVYTFTTAKLQPLVTQPEGKNLIQACLNAPPGQPPSTMPVGTPISRSSGPIPISTPSQPNVTGGLSINKDEDREGEDQERAPTGSKRRRRESTTNQPSAPNASSSAANARAAPSQSPHSPNAPMPAPPPQLANMQSRGAQQINLGSPPQAHSHPHPHQPPQNAYAHGPYPGGAPPDQNMYPGQPMMPSYFAGSQGANPQGNLPSAQSWGAAPVPQSGHYGTRR